MVMVLPNKLLVAVDTEFRQAHTLLIQTACRLDERTVAVQFYRSTAIPALPTDFRASKFLHERNPAYSAHFDRLILRPPKLITPGLSPGEMIADLLEYPLLLLSRRAGAEVRRRDREWLASLPDVECEQPKPPCITVTFAAHFLAADFLRMFGREFYSATLAGDEQLHLPGL